jgi:hypothetical protein
LKFYLKIILLYLISVSPVFADETEIEKNFNLAIYNINNGKYSEASEILNKISIENNSPRIKLEYARSLFLLGKLNESRAIFVELYEYDLPPSVKNTISNFINKIDRINGKIDINIGISKLSNPMKQPAIFTFNSSGMMLTTTNDQKKKNIYTSNYNLSYVKQIDDQFDIKTNFIYRDGPNNFVDQFYTDTSLGSSFNFLPIEVRAGIQTNELNQQSFRLPYTEFAYNLIIIQDIIRVNPRYQFGYLDSRVSDFLSGYNHKFIIPIIYSINPANTISIEPKAEYRFTKSSDQSYKMFGISLNNINNTKYINIDFSLTPKIITYNQIDGFWGSQRIDKILSISANFSSEFIRYENFMPSMSVYCDRNKSNIKFYTQNDCGFSTSVRKLF